MDTLKDEKRESIVRSEAPTIVEDEDRYLSGTRLFLVFVGMLMSVLLIALDQTIVSFSRSSDSLALTTF